jgi:hypothetical protein
MVNFAREIDLSLNSPVWKLPKLRASTLGAAAVCSQSHNQSQSELISISESGASVNV